MFEFAAIYIVLAYIMFVTATSFLSTSHTLACTVQHLFSSTSHGAMTCRYHPPHDPKTACFCSGERKLPFLADRNTTKDVQEWSPCHRLWCWLLQPWLDEAHKLHNVCPEQWSSGKSPLGYWLFPRLSTTGLCDNPLSWLIMTYLQLTNRARWWRKLRWILQPRHRYIEWPRYSSMMVCIIIYITSGRNIAQDLKKRLSSLLCPPRAICVLTSNIKP